MVVSSSVQSILIVDDDVAILGFLKLALEGAGYRVETARNGADALYRVAADRPSLILLDMNMPVMDGWEFCKRMHLHEESATVPIIVMTAGQDAKARARDVGAQGYLGKPFDLDAMFQQIRGLLPGLAPRNGGSAKRSSH